MTRSCQRDATIATLAQLPSSIARAGRPDPLTVR